MFGVLVVSEGFQCFSLTSDVTLTTGFCKTLRIYPSTASLTTNRLHGTCVSFSAPYPSYCLCPAPDLNYARTQQQERLWAGIALATHQDEDGDTYVTFMISSVICSFPHPRSIHLSIIINLLYLMERHSSKYSKIHDQICSLGTVLAHLSSSIPTFFFFYRLRCLQATC